MDTSIAVKNQGKSENSLSSIPSEIWDLVPVEVKYDLWFAQVASNSDLVPKDYKSRPENAFIAIQMGRNVGLKPMQALQNIAVINGRGCVYGDGALAVVRNSGKLEYIEEIAPTDKEPFATCKIKRKDEPEVVRTFSWQEAVKAGLSNKQVWRTYPKRMMLMRARGFALRDAFADYLQGIAIREEVEDYDVKVEENNNKTISNEALNFESETNNQQEDLCT